MSRLSNVPVRFYKPGHLGKINRDIWPKHPGTFLKNQPCTHLFSYLESWRRFGPLSPGGLPLVGGALEVEARVHPEPRGQQVVHHHDAHVLRVAAVAVQTEELGQQRPRVLKERKIVT